MNPLTTLIAAIAQPAVLLGLVAAVAAATTNLIDTAHMTREASPPTLITSSLPALAYSFSSTGVLMESSTAAESSSPYFWLNSGAKLRIEDGVGKTVFGNLSPGDPWQQRYAKSNALDTNGGYQPQNIFRLLTRSHWTDVEQTLRFNIERVNLTNTPNRGQWSGVFLMSRYLDSDTLYYAGVRFDGDAIIKKKYHGTYVTLAATPVFSSSRLHYDRERTPNLIPTNTWHHLKTIVYDSAPDTVTIELWLETPPTSPWQLILRTTDTKAQSDSPPINGPAQAGIRTDFSDVSFADYEIKAYQS